MPTYQYQCTDCGEGLEAVQKFTDEALTECPSCAGRLRKVYSAVGVVFKGSGFYRTDSRTTSDSGSGKKSDAGSGSSSGSGDSAKSSDSAKGSKESGSSSSGSKSKESSGSGSSSSGKAASAA